MSDREKLGDRMKVYEDVSRLKLPRRIPKIIRIDGKAFHTFLKNAIKPYDLSVMQAMIESASVLISEIGGSARCAYIQSDECSILLNDAISNDSQPWFDNNIQKIVSVSSSIFTGAFNNSYALTRGSLEPAAFDARIFLLPDLIEVNNYFIWRQQDAIRNSIQQFGRAHFSHSELHGKSGPEIKEMLKGIGLDYDIQAPWKRRGVVVSKAGVNDDIPLFQEDKVFISSYYTPIVSEDPELPKEENNINDPTTGQSTD